MPLLVPKRVKYRRTFKGQRPGNATRGNALSFGEFGILALTRGWVSSRQIESARKTLTHYTSKGGRVWIRIFPDKPITKKPLDVKMGGGKGELEEYVAVVKPGLVLFEMSGIPEESAREAIRRAGHKLSVRTQFIKNE
jgi:large subunit ribosomal protein L16